MTTTDIMEEFFRRHSASMQMWELRAVTLRYGMEVLFSQTFADVAVGFRHRRRKSLRPSLHEPGLMLAGMMLETLAKAVLVSRGGPLTSRSYRNHDLQVVVEAAGCSLSREERHFLKRMSEFVRWAGRYPAPTTPRGMAVRKDDGELEMIGWSALGTDLSHARRIADRLENLLPGERLRSGMRLPSGHAKPSRRRRSRRK
jgi:hypothetical protein